MTYDYDDYHDYDPHRPLDTRVLQQLHARKYYLHAELNPDGTFPPLVVKRLIAASRYLGLKATPSVIIYDEAERYGPRTAPPPHHLHYDLVVEIFGGNVGGTVPRFLMYPRTGGGTDSGEARQWLIGTNAVYSEWLRRHSFRSRTTVRTDESGKKWASSNGRPPKKPALRRQDWPWKDAAGNDLTAPPLEEADLIPLNDPEHEYAPTRGVPPVMVEGVPRYFSAYNAAVVAAKSKPRDEVPAVEDDSAYTGDGNRRQRRKAWSVNRWAAKVIRDDVLQASPKPGKV